MAQGTIRVVGYIRVSTEEQARGGISLEAQRAKLTDYARAMGHDLVAIHEDAGASAKTLRNRPALRAALDDLEAGRAEGLLICKLDRLTRSVRDLLDLVDGYFRDKSWSLISLSESLDTSTAMGRAMVQFMGVLAELEREQIAERTRDALRHLKSQGVQLGGEGLGWRRVKKLGPDGKPVMVERKGKLRPVYVVVKDVEELATAARIRDLHAQGLTLRAICSTLDAEGRQAKRGGKWQPGTLVRILRRLPAPVAVAA